MKAKYVLDDLDPRGPIYCNNAREVDKECEKRGVFIKRMRKAKERRIIHDQHGNIKK